MMRRPGDAPVPRAAGVAALVAAVIGVVGCAGRGPASSPVPQPSGPRPASTATLAITSPTPGEHVTGSLLRVNVQLTGGTVVPQTSTDLKPDKGHIHLSLDGKVVSMAYGVKQDVTVTPGTHLLTAEFVATDHFPFNPRILKTVTFDVQ